MKKKLFAPLIVAALIGLTTAPARADVEIDMRLCTSIAVVFLSNYLEVWDYTCPQESPEPIVRWSMWNGYVQTHFLKPGYRTTHVFNRGFRLYRIE